VKYRFSIDMASLKSEVGRRLPIRVELLAKDQRSATNDETQLAEELKHGDKKSWHATFC
jgi:hypothetical protein